MTGNAASYSESLRVRLNVTCKGILIALHERGAVVQLPTAQRAERQTTLAIEDHHRGETVYIPARVVRTEPHTPSPTGPQHHVFVEFLELSQHTAAAVRTLIGVTSPIVYGRPA
jgi:hypothetical protein